MMSHMDNVPRGKVMTVLGPVPPENLGCTLSHEHLYADFSNFYSEPTTADGLAKSKLPITMENLYWLRKNPYSLKTNLCFQNEDQAIIDELLFLKQNGCQSLVELTLHGLDRNVGKLREYATASGVNIVAGTGYYISSTHPPAMDRMTQEDIEKVMTSDLLQEADGSGGRCGVIGEIGCSWPMSDNEKKVLRATASVQSELGCPVSIHPGLNTEAPRDAVGVLQEAGAKMENVVMDHLDRCFFSPDSLLEFAELGTYLEFDFFGSEEAYCQFYPEVDFMNDGQRIQMIKCLVEEGYEDKVVISHDIHAKHQMMKYGGFGFSHIMLNVLPKMEERGLSRDVIKKIMETNPQTWLTYK